MRVRAGSGGWQGRCGQQLGNGNRGWEGACLEAEGAQISKGLQARVFPGAWKQIEPGPWA